MAWTNKTSIEQWIVDKAQWRREPGDPPFKFPYNLGWRRNLREVFTWNCEPRGCGFLWPVVPGCDQFTLTVSFILIVLCPTTKRDIEFLIHSTLGLWVCKWSIFLVHYFNFSSLANLSLIHLFCSAIHFWYTPITYY
jgi:hypothetical protein